MSAGNIPLLRSGTLGERRVSSDRSTRSDRAGALRKVPIFAAKFLVTGACFWYLAHRIELDQLWFAIPGLDFGWATIATFVAILQIPVLGLRWRDIVHALGARNERITRAAMIAATAVGAFFAQVLPSVASEGMRAWLLVRLGCDLRNAITSVVLDRAVGVGLLIALGFFVMLLPSGLSAFGGYRDLVLVVYGTLLFTGTFGILFGARILVPLDRWRYTRWLMTLAVDARRVLLGQKSLLILSLGCLSHALTIIIVWSLGRAQGFALPIADSAVLVTIMIGVTLVPISISGWGLRELAVISLLGQSGIAPEKALLFSVCFGLTLAVGSLPGMLAWLFYPFGPSGDSAETAGRTDTATQLN
jgi:uncharacterized protein (TIRG00374 family)